MSQSYKPLAVVHGDVGKNGWTCEWIEGCPYLVPENWGCFHTKVIDLLALSVALIEEDTKHGVNLVCRGDRRENSKKEEIENSSIWPETHPVQRGWSGNRSGRISYASCVPWKPSHSI